MRSGQPIQPLQTIFENYEDYAKLAELSQAEYEEKMTEELTNHSHEILTAFKEKDLSRIINSLHFCNFISLIPQDGNSEQLKTRIHSSICYGVINAAALLAECDKDKILEYFNALPLPENSISAALEHVITSTYQVLITSDLSSQSVLDKISEIEKKILSEIDDSYTEQAKQKINSYTDLARTQTQTTTPNQTENKNKTENKNQTQTTTPNQTQNKNQTQTTTPNQTQNKNQTQTQTTTLPPTTPPPPTPKANELSNLTTFTPDQIYRELALVNITLEKLSNDPECSYQELTKCLIGYLACGYFIKSKINRGYTQHVREFLKDWDLNKGSETVNENNLEFLCDKNITKIILATIPFGEEGTLFIKEIKELLSKLSSEYSNFVLLEKLINLCNEQIDQFNNVLITANEINLGCSNLLEKENINKEKVIDVQLKFKSIENVLSENCRLMSTIIYNLFIKIHISLIKIDSVNAEEYKQNIIQYVRTIMSLNAYKYLLIDYYPDLSDLNEIGIYTQDFDYELSRRIDILNEILIRSNTTKSSAIATNAFITVIFNEINSYMNHILKNYKGCEGDVYAYNLKLSMSSNVLSLLNEMIQDNLSDLDKRYAEYFCLSLVQFYKNSKLNEILPVIYKDFVYNAQDTLSKIYLEIIKEKENNCAATVASNEKKQVTTKGKGKRKGKAKEKNNAANQEELKIIEAKKLQEKKLQINEICKYYERYIVVMLEKNLLIDETQKIITNNNELIRAYVKLINYYFQNNLIEKANQTLVKADNNFPNNEKLLYCKIKSELQTLQNEINNFKEKSESLARECRESVIEITIKSIPSLPMLLENSCSDKTVSEKYSHLKSEFIKMQEMRSKLVNDNRDINEANKKLRELQESSNKSNSTIKAIAIKLSPDDTAKVLLSYETEIKKGNKSRDELSKKYKNILSSCKEVKKDFIQYELCLDKFNLLNSEFENSLKDFESQNAEKEKVAREKAEQERMKREQAAKAEKEKLEKEKAANQRVEKEKAAKAAREKAAREKLAKEQAAKISREQEARTAREQAAKAAREKLIQEKIAQEKLAREKLIQEKIAEEKLAQEKLAQEKLAQEKLAQEKLAQEKLAEEKLALEKIAQEKLEQEKLAQEKAEQETRDDILLNGAGKIVPEAVLDFLFSLSARLKELKVNLLLKGSWIARCGIYSFHSNPAIAKLFSISDIDVVVPYSTVNIEELIKVLTEFGFVPEQEYDPESKKPYIKFKFSYHGFKIDLTVARYPHYSPEEFIPISTGMGEFVHEKIDPSKKETIISVGKHKIKISPPEKNKEVYIAACQMNDIVFKRPNNLCTSYCYNVFKYLAKYKNLGKLKKSHGIKDFDFIPHDKLFDNLVIYFNELLSSKREPNPAYLELNEFIKREIQSNEKEIAAQFIAAFYVSLIKNRFYSSDVDQNSAIYRDILNTANFAANIFMNRFGESKRNLLDEPQIVLEIDAIGCELYSKQMEMSNPRFSFVPNIQMFQPMQQMQMQQQQMQQQQMQQQQMQQQPMQQQQMQQQQMQPQPIQQQQPQQQMQQQMQQPSYSNNFYFSGTAQPSFHFNQQQPSSLSQHSIFSQASTTTTTTTMLTTSTTPTSTPTTTTTNVDNDKKDVYRRALEGYKK